MKEAAGSGCARDVERHAAEPAPAAANVDQTRSNAEAARTGRRRKRKLVAISVMARRYTGARRRRQAPPHARGYSAALQATGTRR
jgi:hypothetical protein